MEKNNKKEIQFLSINKNPCKKKNQKKKVKIEWNKNKIKIEKHVKI
jgi:hypothetical protein